MADQPQPTDSEVQGFLGRLQQYRASLEESDQRLLDAMVASSLGHQRAEPEDQVKPYWVAYNTPIRRRGGDPVWRSRSAGDAMGRLVRRRALLTPRVYLQGPRPRVALRARTIARRSISAAIAGGALAVGTRRRGGGGGGGGGREEGGGGDIKRGGGGGRCAGPEGASQYRGIYASRYPLDLDRD